MHDKENTLILYLHVQICKYVRPKQTGKPTGYLRHLFCGRLLILNPDVTSKKFI